MDGSGKGVPFSSVTVWKQTCTSGMSEVEMFHLLTGIVCFLFVSCIM